MITPNFSSYAQRLISYPVNKEKKKNKFSNNAENNTVVATADSNNCYIFAERHTRSYTPKHDPVK